MIQSGTYLNVIDNSGAKDICCIKVHPGYKRKYASVGDIITVSVKSLRSKRRSASKVKKGDVLKALVIRTKVGFKDFSGKHVSFFENAAVLVNNQFKPLGTRVFGPVPKKFNYTKYLKVASLSAGSIL